jgi:magnesium-protoporphyrin O-methyltransferase
MECCQCQGIEERFDRERAALRSLEYRQDGLKRESQMMVDALVEQGIAGYSLLEVGGGMGALALELIKSGIDRATINEASTAYLEAATAEAERQGLAERINLVHGNAVAMDAELPPADVVTMDKVLCCYDDMPGLIQATVVRARKLYGLVYPRDNWLVKAGFGFENLACWIKGTDFRVFVYPTREVDALIRQDGFQMRSRQTTAKWQVVVYGRVEDR